MASSLNIYPFKTGLDTDLEPSFLPPDAFSSIDNMHIKHGYLEKRNGYAFFGSLSSGDRVMGIFQYIDATNAKTTYVFDKQYGYRFNTGTNAFVQFTSASFSGDATNLFVGSNWQANSASSSNVNRLYISNGKAVDNLGAPTLDGIQYISSATATGTSFLVPILGTSGGNRYLAGCQLLFSFNQRLVVLNTYEGSALPASQYPQRARWCAKIDPSNWNDTVAGGGGYTDAATGEHIISAQLLQNQLIVFFTNSVWALVPTPDPNRAFRWQRINSFRACNGKNASVSYDRYAVSLGSRGIIATDGVESRRVDERIQGFTSDDVNLQEFGKVFCARSYATKRWWTLYPSTSSSENNKVLIYNEDDNSYSTYSLSMNVLGYGNNGFDYSFDDFSVALNRDYSFSDEEVGDLTFQDFIFQENESSLLGGDISGNVYVLESGSSDNGQPVVSQFLSASWNPFREENAVCKMTYIDIFIETNTNTKGFLFFYKDQQETPYAIHSFDFLPPLDFISHITGIVKGNPTLISAPSHGLSNGDVVYIYGVDGMPINSGEAANSYVVTVVTDNHISVPIDSTSFASFTGGGSLYRKQFYRTKTWKRIFAGGTGFQHRIGFDSSNSYPFKIFGFKPFFKRIGKRLID